MRGAGCDREHAKANRDECGTHRLLLGLARAGKVAAGDVAGFVREDTDEFVGRARSQNEPRMDEDVLTAGDERV